MTPKYLSTIEFLKLQKKRKKEKKENFYMPWVLQKKEKEKKPALEHCILLLNIHLKIRAANFLPAK